MVGFQLRTKPLRKTMANFRDLESGICQHCHKKQVVFQAVKETVLFKTCDKTFSFGNIILCHFEKIPVLHYEKKIFYPNGKLNVNCYLLKSRQGVSREGFCCSVTRKELLYVTSDAFFGTAKTCIIKYKMVWRAWNFAHHKMHYAAPSNTSKGCAFFYPVQVGVGAGVYLSYSSAGIRLRPEGTFSSFWCEALVCSSGNGKSAGRFGKVQHIKCS